MPFTPRDIEREVQKAGREVGRTAMRAFHVPGEASVRLWHALQEVAAAPEGPTGPNAPVVTFHEIGLKSVLIFGSIFWAALWGLVGVIAAYSVLQDELDAERAALIVVMYPLAGVALFTPLTVGIAAIYDVIARRFGGFAAVLTELRPSPEARRELDVTVHAVRMRSAVVFGGVWWVALWGVIGFVTTLLEISRVSHNRFGMYAFFFLPVMYGAVFTGASAMLAALYNVAAERWHGFVLGLTELSEVHTGVDNEVRVTVHRFELRSVVLFGLGFWFTVMVILGLTTMVLIALNALDAPWGIWTGIALVAGFLPLTILTTALALIYNGVAQTYGGFELTLRVPVESMASGPLHDMALRGVPDSVEE